MNKTFSTLVFFFGLTTLSYSTAPFFYQTTSTGTTYNLYGDMKEYTDRTSTTTVQYFLQAGSITMTGTINGEKLSDKVNNFGDDITDWINFTSTASISIIDKSSTKWNFQLSTVTTTQSILEMYASNNLGTQQNSSAIDTTAEFTSTGTLSNTQVNTNNISLSQNDTNYLITDFKQDYTDGNITNQLNSFSILNDIAGSGVNGNITSNSESGNYWVLGDSQIYAPMGYIGIGKQFTINNNWKKLIFDIIIPDVASNRFLMCADYGTIFSWGDGYIRGSGYQLEGPGSPTLCDWSFYANYDFLNYNFYDTNNITIGNYNSGGVELTISIIIDGSNYSVYDTSENDAFVYSDSYDVKYNKIAVWSQSYPANSAIQIKEWSEYSKGYKSTGTYNYVYDSGSANTQWNNFISSHSSVSGTTDIHYRFRTSADNLTWTSWTDSINTEVDYTYALTVTNNRYIEVEATFHSPNHLTSAYITTMYFQYQLSNAMNTIRYVAEDVQMTGNLKDDGYKLFISSIQFSDNTIIFSSSTYDYSDEISALQTSTGTIMSNFNNYGALAGSQTWTGRNFIENKLGVGNLINYPSGKVLAGDDLEVSNSDGGNIKLSINSDGYIVSNSTLGIIYGFDRYSFGDGLTNKYYAPSIKFKSDGDWSGGTYPSRIEFWTRLDNIGGVERTLERMRIDRNGNIGIANTNPSYKLDVSGDINITGNYYKNGSNVIFDVDKILISDYGEVLVSDNGNVLMNE